MLCLVAFKGEESFGPRLLLFGTLLFSVFSLSFLDGLFLEVVQLPVLEGGALGHSSRGCRCS